MEKFILDTCTWIEYFHHRYGVREHVEQLPTVQISVSEVTLAELTYGAIRKGLDKDVGQFDMLIGATALHYGLTVVTDNIKHFSLMPGVKCVNWVEREK